MLPTVFTYSTENPSSAKFWYVTQVTVEANAIVTLNISLSWFNGLQAKSLH